MTVLFTESGSCSPELSYNKSRKTSLFFLSLLQYTPAVIKTSFTHHLYSTVLTSINFYFLFLFCFYFLFFCTIFIINKTKIHCHNSSSSSSSLCGQSIIAKLHSVTSKWGHPTSRVADAAESVWCGMNWTPTRHDRNHIHDVDTIECFDWQLSTKEFSSDFPAAPACTTYHRCCQCLLLMHWQLPDIVKVTVRINFGNYTLYSSSLQQLKSSYLSLYGHTKTTEQRTIIQQYGDWYTGRWWVDCYIWYSDEEPGRAAAPPPPQSPPRCTKCVTVHQSTATVYQHSR